MLDQLVLYNKDMSNGRPKNLKTEHPTKGTVFEPIRSFGSYTLDFGRLDTANAQHFRILINLHIGPVKELQGHVTKKLAGFHTVSDNAGVISELS